MRRRLQRNGYLIVKHGSWMLQYRAYPSKVKRAVVLGAAFRAYEKRCGKWVAVGPILDRDGLKPKQAERLAWDQYLSRVDGLAVRPHQACTVGAFWAQRYWPWACDIRQLDASTRGQYESLWRQYLEPVLGAVPLVDVRIEHAEAAVELARNSGKSQHTVYHVRKVGSAILSRAIATEYYDRVNPFHRITVSTPANARDRYALTPPQARACLDAIKPAYWPLVLAALLTGCNVAELLGLDWSHVDLDGGWIHVRRHFYRGEYGDLKTPNRRRDIPIAGALRDALAGLNPRETGIVFAGRSGEPLRENNIRRRHLSPLTEKLGLPGPLGWHIFRHTFASWLADLGVSDFDRRYLMGHAPASMTDRYTHENGDRLRAAVEAVAGRLTDAPARGRVIPFRRPA